VEHSKLSLIIYAMLSDVNPHYLYLEHSNSDRATARHTSHISN